MQRASSGYGRGARMKFEEDELSISGRHPFGLTMGSPVALRIGNTEWPRWVEVMSPEPVDREPFPKGRGAALTRPRPGHADLVGMQKYGFDEARNVLERASARETAAASPWAPSRGVPRRARHPLVAHTLSIETVRVPEGGRCRPRMTSSAWTPTRCGASTRDLGRDGRPHRPRPRRRRHPRRRRRGARVRRPARTRQLHATGIAGSTASWPARS
jgi:hypothetical protein